MLTPEDNDIVNHFGPGTPMGNLFRRYWTPALLSEEIPAPDSPPVKVRLLCEDLVAFRDTQGRVGLVDSCCPHRGSGMFFGRNEEDGLRCVYHGWKFDVTGQCVDMPSEPPNSVFKNKLTIPTYPTRESGGVIWTYMGPKDKMPGFRDFGTENLPREKWKAAKRVAPMTFMQDMEGHLDTTHPSWLHMWGGAWDLDADADGSDTPGSYNSNLAQHKFWAFDRAPRVELEETWYGYRGVGLRTTPNGNTQVRTYVFAFPGLAGPSSIGHYQVPMDDETTMNFMFDTIHSEERRKLLVDHGKRIDIPDYPYRGVGPERNLENDFMIDREAQKNGTIYSGIGAGRLDSRSVNVGPAAGFQMQDVMARKTSFRDRTKEHLGTLDRKIIAMRRMLIKAAKDLANGIEPPALDPSLPFDKIGWLDQVIAPNADWHDMATERDPNYARLFAGDPALAKRQELSPVEAS